MNEVEELIREALHRHEADIPLVEQMDAALVGRRTRRRQVLNGIGAFAVVVLLAIGLTSGVNSLLRAEAHRPAEPPLPAPEPPLPAPQETTVGRQGFVGLAPSGTDPSLPQDGDLVISFSEPCCPMQYLFVYRDGRIIWAQYNNVEPDEKGWVNLVPQRANKYETGYLEQRLTPEGVQLLRTELVGSGLFDQSQTFKRVGDAGNIDITVWKGGTPVRLRWWTDQKAVDATTEQAREIERLIAILKDPEAWLPDDAWADRKIRPFIPSRYQVVMHFYSSGGHTPDDPGKLPPPADDLLRAADFVRGSSACQTVSIAEARRIDAELRDAFGTSFGGPFIPYGGIFGTPVTIDPVLPDADGCEGWS